MIRMKWNICPAKDDKYRTYSADKVEHKEAYYLLYENDIPWDYPDHPSKIAFCKKGSFGLA